jgi:hypothetical protein
MHTPRRPILLALLAGLLAATPAAAHAQLGGFLKKKIGERVADKVLGQDQSSSNSRGADPTFDEDLLEITDARIDQLLRGLKAEAAAGAAAMRAQAEAKQKAPARRAAYAAAMKKYDAAADAHQKAAEARGKCQLDVIGSTVSSAMANPAVRQMNEAMMKLPEAEREAFQARIEARQEKMAEAEARGDKAAVTRLAAEMDADMTKTTGVSMSAMQAGSVQGGQGTQQMLDDHKKCGELPPPPEEPVDSSRIEISVRDSVQAAAFAASGLTDMQYSMMRERVAAWLRYKEEKQSLGAHGFTDAELAALAKRHEALKAEREALLVNDPEKGWSF